MWTVVHVVEEENQAREIEEKLNSMGFFVRIESFIHQGKDRLYEISTLEFEAGELEEAMMELGII